MAGPHAAAYRHPHGRHENRQAGRRGAPAAGARRAHEGAEHKTVACACVTDARVAECRAAACVQVAPLLPPPLAAGDGRAVEVRRAAAWLGSWPCCLSSTVTRTQWWPVKQGWGLPGGWMPSRLG